MCPKNASKIIYFSFKMIIVFSTQNQRFHHCCSRDRPKTLGKAIHFSFQIHSFFFAAKRHQICPQEQKRTPKELRASRSGKIHAQRPGRAKTVAREREPLQRLHRTVCFARLLRTSRKTGRTYTLRKRNGEGSEGEPRREKGPRRGAASVQRDGNTAAAAWRWRGT